MKKRIALSVLFLIVLSIPVSPIILSIPTSIKKSSDFFLRPKNFVRSLDVSSGTIRPSCIVDKVPNNLQFDKMPPSALQTMDITSVLRLRERKESVKNKTENKIIK